MNETNLDTLTMDQVRAMDDATLRRLVAEMLGWRIEHEEHKFQDFVIYRESFIVRPDGSKFKPQVIDKYLEQELVSALPDWPECLDDAWDLLANTTTVITTGHGRVFVELTVSQNSQGAAITRYEGEPTGGTMHPARAITLAWVAWKLAERTTA